MKQEQEIIKKVPSKNTIYENMIAEIKNKYMAQFLRWTYPKMIKKLEGLGENIF